LHFFGGLYSRRGGGGGDIGAGGGENMLDSMREYAIIIDRMSLNGF